MKPCRWRPRHPEGTHHQLEWTSSHQCTSWGWARWSRFADEQKSHPPCPHLFSAPKFSPLLPTTYLPPPTCHLPPPPTSHPQSIARAPEPSSGSEPRVMAVELERDPHETQVSILSFFLFVCFVCSFLRCKKKQKEEGDDNFATIAYFFLLWSCVAIA